MVALNIVPKNKPVIGISGGSADSKSVANMMSQIRSAGATPLLLCNHANRNPADDINKIDAFIAMGNNLDINPEWYNEAALPCTKIDTNLARANYEKTMLLKALAQKIPVLGICGGAQLLNTVAGGTLDQDLVATLGHNQHAQQEFNIPGYIPVQTVKMVQGTTLCGITDGIDTVYTPTRQPLPKGMFMENSMHHQAVKRVGTGFRVAAYSQEANGQHVIEAIEIDPNFEPLKGQFAMGIQWHPEFGASQIGAKLASTLVEKAADCAVAQVRNHPPEEALLETTFSAGPETRNLDTFVGREIARRAQVAANRLPS